MSGACPGASSIEGIQRLNVRSAAVVTDLLRRRRNSVFALPLHLAREQGDSEAGASEAFGLGQQPPPMGPELPDPARHRLDKLQERFRRAPFPFQLPHDGPTRGCGNRLLGLSLRRSVAGPASLPPL